MVKQKKTQSKKQQPKKGGIDFKKFKKKIGRKLPPAQNATNTEIKTKEEMSHRRDEAIPNRLNFRSVVRASCSCISQIGDSYSVFQMLENVTIDQLFQNPPLDNFCALLRVLVTLDCKPSRLSQESVVKLSQVLPKYLLDLVADTSEYEPTDVMMKNSSFYLLPCFILFDRTSRLMDLVLESLGSLIMGDVSLFPHDGYSTSKHFKRINAVVCVLILIYTDTKMRQKIDLHKDRIKCILQTLLTFQSSEKFNPTIEERHKVRTAVDRLKLATGVEL